MKFLPQTLLIIILKNAIKCFSRAQVDSVNNINSPKAATTSGYHDISAALMMLVTQPWDSDRDRLCYFNASMDSLSAYWLHSHSQYPLILMAHSERWSYRDKTEIRRRWKMFDIHFINVDQYFQSAPVGVALEDAANPLSNLGYKNMLNFMFNGFTRVPQLMKYRYLLRLDDDSCIKDNINYDMFRQMKLSGAHYAFRDMYSDLDHVVVGLSDFVDNYMKQVTNNFTFIAEKNHSGNSENFNRPVTKYANSNLYAWRKRQDFKTTISFSGNFEIIDTHRYIQRDIQHFVNHVVESNMIYHRRWTECSIRYYFAEMFWRHDQVLWLCDFDYQHSVWETAKMCEHRTNEDAVVKYWKSEQANN